MTTRRHLPVAALALTAVMLLSCGVKTDLRPAREAEPGVVNRMDGRWEGRDVVLRGEVSPAGGAGREQARILGARVYHVWFNPEETPCDGCPVSFSGYQDAALADAGKGGFQCRVPVEPKAGTHFFQVRLVGPGDALGLPSNRLKLTVEAR